MDETIYVPAPWDRQSDETEQAFQAFAAYRDDKERPRSLARVASLAGFSRSSCDRWSAKHDWRERTRLYDQELDREKQTEDKLAVHKMARRHASKAATMIDLLTKPAEVLLVKWQESQTELDELSEIELYRMVLAASKVLPALVQVERLARGESTEHVTISERTDSDRFIPGSQSPQDWLHDTYSAIGETLDRIKGDAK